MSSLRQTPLKEFQGKSMRGQYKFQKYQKTRINDVEQVTIIKRNSSAAVQNICLLYTSDAADE